VHVCMCVFVNGCARACVSTCSASKRRDDSLKQLLQQNTLRRCHTLQHVAILRLPHPRVSARTTSPPSLTAENAPESTKYLCVRVSVCVCGYVCVRVRVRVCE
jgi:hypothetical protein